APLSPQPHAPSIPAPPSAQPQSPPPALSSPPRIPTDIPPDIPPESLKMLEGLLQDARNAHVFYAHVATVAPHTGASEFFIAFSQQCNTQIECYHGMLEKYFNHSFTPSETEINTNLPYENALALALVEENKGINKLADLLCGFAHPEAERALQRVINKKMAGYNQLQLLDREK
ncbi:MAG: hypothetical protein FWC07_09250, partial [Defluviitaleaceae bacterium]|nr:hypothetical protein [Defluviitaleaceae bacterium]